MNQREVMAQEIANFRYGLIADVISRSDLAPGEQKAILVDVASKNYDIPYSTRTTVSLRTLERYLSIYREKGIDGLKPSKPGPRFGRIPMEHMQKALDLRRENPKRSIERIIFMLEESGEVPLGILKNSTVYDHCAKLGLTRVAETMKKNKFHRFSAAHRNERWQGDVCHLLYLPHPDDPKKRKKVYLVAWIDDYSRLIVHGQIYWHERLPMLEDSFKKATLRYGIPEQIYVDNAKIYSSLHFEAICGRLGLKLSHSRPYRPQGRGKVEKFFQFVRDSFVSEAMLLLDKGELTTLHELNQYFCIWVDRYYHEKVHTSTKQKPILRYTADSKKQRFKSLEEIVQDFLYEETRTVDKTCVIKFNHRKYEVEPVLARCKVNVRYDPYDTKEIQVWYEGKRYKNAKPLSVYRDVPDFSSSSEELDDMPEAKPTGLNFLKTIKQKDDEKKRNQRMVFNKLNGGDAK